MTEKTKIVVYDAGYALIPYKINTKTGKPHLEIINWTDDPTQQQNG